MASEVAGHDALTLSNVNAHYGRSHVLHGVSLRLGKGRLLALLGRNGAGKTTTMLAIAGLLRATDGKVTAGGRAIEALSPEAIAWCGVRLVPQGRRVFASLSVEENLQVARQKRAVPHPWSSERVYTMFPQLARRHRQRAGTLSGGEQQMLAIGRALLAKPRLLLLDEPSMGLAPIIVQDIFRKLREINADGITIFLVEQNVKQALKIAQHGYVLESGKIVLDGSGSALLHDPKVLDAYMGG